MIEFDIVRIFNDTTLQSIFDEDTLYILNITKGSYVCGRWCVDEIADCDILFIDHDTIGEKTFIVRKKVEL